MAASSRLSTCATVVSMPRVVDVSRSRRISSNASIDYLLVALALALCCGCRREWPKPVSSTASPRNALLCKYPSQRFFVRV